MSEGTHEDGEQLFDTETDEVAETANDSDETQTENSEEEQEQALNLEEQKASTETEKLNQIKAWQKKVDEGKASIDDLPPAQKWMKEHLKSKEEEVDHRAIAKELAKEAIQEEREAAKFNSLKEDLENMSLPREKKLMLEDRFKTLREKGLSKVDSLEFAIDATGIDLSGVSELKRKMRIPTRGVNRGSGDDFDRPYSEVAKTVSPEKRQEYLKKLVQN